MPGGLPKMSRSYTQGYIMTPLQIQMMLHYYAIAEPYAMRQPEHAGSRSVIDQRMKLINLGLLSVVPETPSGYRPTELGREYVDRLCNTPINAPIPDVCPLCSIPHRNITRS